MIRQSLLIALVLIPGCRRIGRPSASDAGNYTLDGGHVTTAGVLGAVGECALKNYRDFSTLADDLDAKSAKAETDPSARDSARDAWKNAIDVWERLEVFQIGPAALSSFPGGKDLREHIYSWPLGGRCAIEQGIVSQAYSKPGFADGLIATRGLLAAEYSLFYDGSDNGCGPMASINTSGAWAALGAPEITKRKAGYTHAVSADVRARAAALVAFWDPAQGNFLAELKTAGKGSTTYTSELAAFAALNDAMFYMEHTLKELKLAKPLGLRDCAGACPDMLESLFAHRSKQHIRNNILGFRMLFSGCDGGTGLAVDDMIAALGHTDAANGMTADIANALAAVDAIEEDDLALSLAQDLPSVRAVYDAVKRITDRLKNEIVTILDLELPKRVEGDND